MSEGPQKVLEALDALMDELGRDPQGWENPTLDRYLEAMRAWLADTLDKSPREPSWDLIADMLRAAAIYE